MPLSPRAFAPTLALFITTAGASAAAINSECETVPSLPSKLYAYFGVTAYSVSPSTHLTFSGSSAAVGINFAPTSFARSGVGVGTLGVSAPDLSIPASANTFSVTIDWPYTQQLVLQVTVREDDNMDGAITPDNGDDEWGAPEIVLQQGRHVYNIPSASFDTTATSSGNGIRNFTTTTRMAYILNFETRRSLPGGQITTPVTLHADHIGFFVGPQTLPPPPACPGDADGDNAVGLSDIALLITNWTLTVPPAPASADLDNSGHIGLGDVAIVVNNWSTTCP